MKTVLGIGAFLLVTGLMGLGWWITQGFDWGPSHLPLGWAMPALSLASAAVGWMCVLGVLGRRDPYR